MDPSYAGDIALRIGVTREGEPSFGVWNYDLLTIPKCGEFDFIGRLADATALALRGARPPKLGP